MSKKLKEFARIMVTGWAEDKTMGWAVNQYADAIGVDRNARDAAEAIANIFGCNVIFQTPVRAFVSKNMRKLSAAAWDARPNERLLVAAESDLGLKSAKGSIKVKVRERDTRHDWGVVK